MTSPFEAAMNPNNNKPSELAKHKFGYVFHVDARFVALVPGQGRVAFDERVHDIKKRSVETTIQVEHKKSDGSTYPVKQTELDWSKQWAVTRDSLIALNLKNASDLKNRYVEYEWVGIGEFYKVNDGTQRERQGMRFIRVFNNREECEAAEREFYSPKSPATAPAVAPDVQAFFNEREAKAAVAAPVVADVNDAQRAMMATFLPPLWQKASFKADVFHALIAANPVLAATFNANSPEVVALTSDVTF
jgi:hypothetical protein